jgi:hypothetical protein
VLSSYFKGARILFLDQGKGGGGGGGGGGVASNQTIEVDGSSKAHPL